MKRFSNDRTYRVPIAPGLTREPARRPSKYFYFENLPGRRLRPDRVEQAVAEQEAKRFAREEQDKVDSQ
jgi:hypothetical protein